MTTDDSAVPADVVCHCCGKDLTDPKNAGDPDVEGQWVCRDGTCRAVHEVEMTVTLEDHQIKSDENVVADCMDCGAYLTHDEKVERSEGTYCELCAPPLVTDGGTPAEEVWQYRAVFVMGGSWRVGGWKSKDEALEDIDTAVQKGAAATALERKHEETGERYRRLPSGGDWKPEEELSEKIRVKHQ